MPAADSTFKWNQINSTTEKVVLPRVVDQIFRSNPVLLKLWRKGTKKSGGSYIVQPLAYAEGPSGWFEGMQPLEVDEVEQITSAMYHWKHAYASVTIRRDDELQNNGPEAFVNLLEQKMNIARKTMKNKLAQGLYSDGSNPLEMVGLQAMVTGSGVTYGNISKTDNSWWRSVVDTTTTTLSIFAMRQMMGDLTEDDETPDLIVTTQDIYDIYYSILQPQQRFASADMARGGFRSIRFEGLPLVVDSHCPDSNMFFLNTDYIDLVSHRQENMRFEPFKKPFRQQGRSAFILWYGNLTGSNCRFQGRFTGITD